MGKTRAERTWEKPRPIRHVWVRFRDLHPQQPPDPGVVLAWRKGTKLHQMQSRQGRWEAFVIVVRTDADGEPFVAQQWVDERDIRPIQDNPNRAFGLR